MTVHVPLEIIYSAWMYERVVHLDLQHRRLVLGFSQARMNTCRPYRILSDVYPQDCSDGNEQQGTLELLIHMDRPSWLSGPPAGLRSDAVRTHCGGPRSTGDRSHLLVDRARSFRCIRADAVHKGLLNELGRRLGYPAKCIHSCHSFSILWLSASGSRPLARPSAWAPPRPVVAPRQRRRLLTRMTSSNGSRTRRLVSSFSIGCGTSRAMKARKRRLVARLGTVRRTRSKP